MVTMVRSCIPKRGDADWLCDVKHLAQVRLCEGEVRQGGRGQQEQHQRWTRTRMARAPRTRWTRTRMARAPTKMTRRTGTAKAPPGRTREAKVTPKIDKKDKSQIW